MTANRRFRGAGLVAFVFLFAAGLCVSVLWLSCDETTEPPISDDAASTLSSFAQVDDYPFYVMRYYGDYGSGFHLSAAERGRAPYDALDEAPAWGCTTFAALSGEGAYLLGRNFDWHNHMALLLYTDPSDGYASVSMVDLSYLGFSPGDTSDANMRRLLAAPSWPFDGMNETGVAIGMMAVPHAEGGNDPEKPTIGSLDVIRVVLDHAANTEEAVELLSGYNVDFGGGPPVHYLVSDANRRSVVIEFIDDEMQVIPHESPWQVSTNFVITGYAWNGSPSDCWRYNRAYNTLQAANGIMNRGEAMNLLAAVSQTATMWSVVFGGEDGAISVAVGRDYATVHEFTIEGLGALR